MCLKNYGGWMPYKEVSMRICANDMFKTDERDWPLEDNITQKSLVEDNSTKGFFDDLIPKDSPFSYQEGGSHYQDDSGVPQVAEWCMRKNLGFAEGNIVKYVARHDKKNGIEDIKKAMQYLKFIAYVKYGEII